MATGRRQALDATTASSPRAPALIMGLGLGGFIGLVDHQLLGIHHVRDDLGAPLGWDLAFLAFGLLLILAGAALARSGDRAVRHVEATPRAPVGPGAG